MNGTSLFRKRRRVTDNAPSFKPPEQQSFTSDDTQSEATSDHSSRPTTAIREDDPPSSFSPPRRNHRRDSSLSSFTEFKSSLRRRSTSLRSKGRDTSSLWDNLASTITNNADRRQASTSRPQLNISTTNYQQSTDNLTLDGSAYRVPSSAVDSRSGKQHFQHTWSSGGLRRGEENNLRPSTALGAPYSANPTLRSASSTLPSNSSNPRVIAKRITDIALKRISLLNYLRLIYATQTHWFNTYRFTSSQISSFPSMSGTRLTRRTQSLFHLGLSLPFALDPARTSLPDYLRALSTLLSEYEIYLANHPHDGVPQSAYRAKLPGIFKRGVSGSAMAKARRGSSADGLLTSPHSAEESGGLGGFGGTAPRASFPNMAQEDGLLAGEEYSLLLTPSLPFECDYAETFGTVCDVLCEIYQHLMQAVAEMAEGVSSGNTDANLSGVAEMFTKVDGRIKKLVLVGLVREFEEASRQGIRSEVAGVGKLVLGGLV